MRHSRPILDDKVLSRAVSTVDDLDLVQGQIAAVLALAIGSGNVGHYGYGTGASAPLPPHIREARARKTDEALSRSPVPRSAWAASPRSRASTGFVRVLVIAAVLGTTYLGNTFQAANSVSNVLFELLAAGALSAVLVPTFVTLVDAGNDAEADRLANGLLGYALAVMGVITVLGVVFAPLLARLLSSGAPNAQVGAEQRHLATFLLWFFVPQVVLYAFGAIATGLLYAKRRFAITAAAPMASSFVMVVCFIIFRVLAGPDARLRPDRHREGAARGRRHRWVSSRSSRSSMVAAWRPGFSLRPRWDRSDPVLSRFSRLAVWGVALHSGAAMLLGASLVAGNGVAGGVVAYQVAFTFFLAPYAVLAQPIITTILPQLSNDAAAGDLDALRPRRFAGRSIGWRCS